MYIHNSEQLCDKKAGPELNCTKWHNIFSIISIFSQNLFLKTREVYRIQISFFINENAGNCHFQTVLLQAQ